MAETITPEPIFFRGTEVQFGQYLPIPKHSRSNTAGSNNDVFCLDKEGRPSLTGTVILIQRGTKQPTAAIRCLNCLYTIT